MDIYSKLRKELKALFKDLFFIKKAEETQRRMAKIVLSAKQISPLVFQEALVLQEEIDQFLQHPHDVELAERMKSHASKLQAETRDL